MKIKMNKSIFLDPKSCLFKAKTVNNKSIPKPHKLITNILFIFCFWNFIYQIISIIHIYLDDYATNKSHLTWSIASICMALFFTLALYYLHDNRKQIKKMLRKNNLDVKSLDYLLMTGYLCFIITVSIMIFFNHEFENPKGNYGFMLSFSNLILLSSFIFLLTKDFKIKLIFILILFIFWASIIFFNDMKDQFYELQIMKIFIRIICNLSMIIIFIYFYEIKPKKQEKSQKNQVISNNLKIKEQINYHDEESRLFNFLNQIHSAIVIFDEEMDLKYYNKEIFSFLTHSLSKNQEASVSQFDKIEKMPMSWSKSDFSKPEILQKLNDITNIRLFESEDNPIKEVIIKFLYY